MSVRTRPPAPRRPAAPSGNGSDPALRQHGRRDRWALEARRAARPLAVFVLALAAAITCAGFILKNIGVSLPWSDSYAVRIAVDDAKGVVPKLDEVRMAGVPIGRVSAVDLVRRQPVLTLRIDTKYAPVYRDARIELRPHTPLQDMYVDVVDRGSAEAGELDERTILPAARTQVPVDISEVLDTFDDDTRLRIEQTLDEVSVGLPDRGRDLRLAFAAIAPFLEAAERLTGELAVRRERTRRLIHNMRLLTEELGLRNRELVELVSAGQATFGTISSNAPRLAALIDELPATLTQVVSSFATLRASLDEVDPTLVALRPVARELAPGLGALRSFSIAARPALRALGRPVRRLVPLSRALAPTSTSLAAAFAALRPQAPRLDRVTAAIVPCELAVQKFFQWTPSVFKFADAHGAYPRGESVGAADLQLARAASCTDGGGR